MEDINQAVRQIFGALVEYRAVRTAHVLPLAFRTDRADRVLPRQFGRLGNIVIGRQLALAVDDLNFLNPAVFAVEPYAPLPPGNLLVGQFGPDAFQHPPTLHEVSILLRDGDLVHPDSLAIFFLCTMFKNASVLVGHTVTGSAFSEDLELENRFQRIPPGVRIYGTLWASFWACRLSAVVNSTSVQ